MNEKTVLKIEMILKSDAIFGSGYSIPGEEDIAVCKDQNGYPYMKGSTFKGLLRESMERMAYWCGMENTEIDKMMGAADWHGEAENRRIQVTSLRMQKKPEQVQECYDMRVFTSLEHGVAKKGTLRMAACISRGTVFAGEITCAQEDVPFVEDALKGIKWVGTLRNRGFGEVEIKSEVKKTEEKAEVLKEAGGLFFHLHAEEPLVITDINRSRGNHYETLGYIPGTAVRGMVIGKLASSDPQWFEENKKELLQEIYFLDAVPVHGNKAVIPSIKGFYEKKDGSDFQTVLKDGKLSPGVKRAGLGSFCSIDGDTLSYWQAKIDGVTRIKKSAKEDKLMFQSRYLCENQDFEGYILLKNKKFAEKIAEVFSDEVWVGADRFEGFGKCSVSFVKAQEEPKWRKEYGYAETESCGDVLYLLAASPFCMLDESGAPCGIREAELKEKLEVDSVTIEQCSTSVTEYRTYNRTWQCSSPSVQMYDRGSMFKIKCSSSPKVENVLKLQKEGIGIRKAEGYGQILFIKPDIYENICKKAAVEQKQAVTAVASLRRAKYCWIMQQDEKKEGWKGDLSDSQLGEIQGLLEKAKRNGGDLCELEDYFEKNRKERGARHGERFKTIEDFIERVLDCKLQKTRNMESAETEKIELLCELFDYSRKGEEE